MLVIAVVLFVIFLALALRLRNWEVFVFTFVFLYPMRAIIPVNNYILNFISPDNVATLFLILSYTGFNSKYNSIKFKDWSFRKKNVFYFLIVFAFILLHLDTLKAGIIEDSEDIAELPKRLIRDLMSIYGIFLIFKRSNNLKIIKAFDLAILIGSSIIGLSIFFDDYFVSLGFRESFSVGERGSGLLHMNPNPAGHYCAFVIGYLIARIERPILPKIWYIIAIGFCLVGIMGTASRASLIAVFLVFLYFLFKNRKLNFRNLSMQIVFFVLFYFILVEFGALMQNRLVEASESEGGTLKNRQNTWKVYISDIGSNMDYLVYGNTRPKPIRYSPHNYYIKVLWSFGLFLLFYLFLLTKRINKGDNQLSKGSFNVSYPLLMFLITSLAGAYSPHFILIMILGFSDGLFPSNSHKNDKINV